MNAERREFEGIEIFGVREWREAGIAHGFLGAGVDSRGDRARCDEIVKRYCGATTLEVHRLRQIHSDLICDASSESCENREADGWMFSFANNPAIFGIETADCAPVLLVARDRSFGAALHCGWRGAGAGLLPRAIALFAERGVPHSELELCIGPCAGGCCYEVKDDVTKIISEGWCGAGLIARNDKTYFDLKTLLSAQALHVGLTEAQIARIDACTICDLRFFSYRRQFDLAGRELSFLCTV